MNFAHILSFEYKVYFLGVHNPQYFQGFGTEDNFDYSVYGVGESFNEALDDALELLSQSEYSNISDDIVQNLISTIEKKDMLSDRDNAETIVESKDYGITEEDIESDDYELPLCHVGIKFNF